MGAEEFGFEVMVGNELVDAPEADGTEGRHVEMGVDIDDGEGVEFLADDGEDLLRPELGVGLGHRLYKISCSVRLLSKTLLRDGIWEEDGGCVGSAAAFVFFSGAAWAVGAAWDLGLFCRGGCVRCRHWCPAFLLELFEFGEGAPEDAGG